MKRLVTEGYKIYFEDDPDTRVFFDKGKYGWRITIVGGEFNEEEAFEYSLLIKYASLEVKKRNNV